MKKLIPGIFLILLAFASCKKDKPTAPEPAQADNPAINQGDSRLTITTIAPTSGLPNTVVTINGANFGTTVADLMVFFNGVKATVQSVTPTAIKVLVPVTTTGNINVIKMTEGAQGPVFSYLSPELNSAYISGDVTLKNQSEINTFLELNKGKQIQITGNLNIGGSILNNSPFTDINSLTGLAIIKSVSGAIYLGGIGLSEAPFLKTITAAGSIAISNSAFTSLSFSGMQPYAGSLALSSLSQLTRVDINLSPSVGTISISACPLLADLSFLNDISTANQIAISGVAATSITMDKLPTLGSYLSISGNRNLTRLSFKTLASIGSLVPGGIAYLFNNPLLSDINFKSLTTITGKLTVRSTNISNMAGFGALQKVGSLLIEGNSQLTDLHGLEQLSVFSSAPILSSGLYSSSAISRVNGIYIGNNEKLASLDGLQNAGSVQIAYIVDNKSLNDLCPFKKAIAALNVLAPYKFSYRNSVDQNVTATMPALTMLRNGNNLTTKNAVDAGALCQ
ncbi:IPT/TIG domain-containing protein [Pedobacter sp. PWIIR3]